MTQLTSKASLVAMVQSATMAPSLVLALAAGAIADMYDRRTVALVGLGIAFSASAALSALSFMDLITPAILLTACVVTGIGVSLLGPAWQASVSEQVPAESLAPAITLNGISFNIARSFGPALGGVIVAVAGGAAAFTTTALFYLPLFSALFRWRRVQEPARLPPEGLLRAIVSGVRYILHSPPIRTVVGRTVLTAALGSAVPALMPLVARNVLLGGAQTFGMLVGAFGFGAVAGALAIAYLRRRFPIETVVSAATVLTGAAGVGVGFSTDFLLTLGALFLAGAGWMLTINEYNLAIQSVAPRWVTGRALAMFQAAVAGGMALGAWAWGNVAQDHGIATALKLAGLGLMLLPISCFWLRLGARGSNNTDALEAAPEPEVALALSLRSGPIRVELEYSIPQEDARAFYRLMQQVRRIRSRSGGYGWTLSRDVARPERWMESFSCPTWLDYLRQRTRITQAERELQARALALLSPGTTVQVRRWLERPVWLDPLEGEAGARAIELP